MNAAAVTNNDNISISVRKYTYNILKANLNYIQISEDVFLDVEFEAVPATRNETQNTVANTNVLYILHLNRPYFYLK